ncbi:aminomethyl-transferring glycine dehydrogenase subunit GcvPA [Erythrobacter arachoides]|uniref:Probable glycine dehydrogenase (decarboxylating) subunit 1 n=1 Tax=Aurantiacibacter arachoides TaxID=1850444 RepID=A0A845A364_9SPHN|nr:aminomethyl-transferring glycine dehydrogenase subunit GcvPA [Aurantiacibacter arachoides]MXO94144.1 aminomethyl-transferring glycine dehydrogenase subunit GcvPA [Aurantiacibacter arachoides]GGD65692.1 putative glycine dehydrogenase (decarboxylating) subunit 1 [Aurantiacibacter arachoides]
MRYLPLTDTDRTAMLGTIGADSIDALFADIAPAQYLDGPIEGLPLHATEMAVEKHMRALSQQNLAAGDAPFFCGAGAYRHHVPATVDHLIQRGEFLTAYTPYQPEIAQGTLQMLFEFQSQVARLYGCAVANASMYDGSTACWEAIVMAGRQTKRNRVLIDGGLHPHYVGVAQTMAKFTHAEIAYELPTLEADAGEDALIARIDEATSCVVVQYPDILGRVPDLARIADAAHAAGALLIAVNTEPVALGALEAPGNLGADIVVGEGQSIGVGLQFGGPYLGLFAVRDAKLVRQMPGRLCGETVDADGKRGFVLTLSTREQHIRREKATSNICTNSGLCALAFSIHMTLLGEKGLTGLAAENHRLACLAADKLAAVPGVEVVNTVFFNEFTLRLPIESRPLVRDLAANGVLAGVALGRLFPDAEGLAHGLVVAVTETTSEADIDALASALKEALA